MHSIVFYLNEDEELNDDKSNWRKNSDILNFMYYYICQCSLKVLLAKFGNIDGIIL